MGPEKSSFDPRSVALFLDLDGTLIDIAPRPEAVRAPAHLAALLQAVFRGMGGALAILSGRPIRTIDALTEPLRLPAAGVHGAELRRAPGGEIVARASPLAPHLVGVIRALVGDREGLNVEVKTYSVAVHYRGAPEEAARLEEALRELLSRDHSGLALAKGRLVLEAVPLQATKGAALLDFMSDPPFAGRRPIMVGDDATDETAMAAARSLGGEGLKVAGEHFAATDAHFSGPAAVLEWLETLANGVEI